MYFIYFTIIIIITYIDLLDFSNQLFVYSFISLFIHLFIILFMPVYKRINKHY